MVATTSAQSAEPAEASGVPVQASPDIAEVADTAALAQLGQLRPGQAARPQLLRALNEQLLLRHIRQLGRCSRAELARLSGLSKPTVSQALANVERSGRPASGRGYPAGRPCCTRSARRPATCWAWTSATSTCAVPSPISPAR